MLYEWLGLKSHKRYRSVSISGGRAGGKRRVVVECTEVKRGETFEPTEQEIHSFRDLMRPIGVAVEAPPPPLYAYRHGDDAAETLDEETDEEA